MGQKKVVKENASICYKVTAVAKLVKPGRNSWLATFKINYINFLLRLRYILNVLSPQIVFCRNATLSGDMWFSKFK